MVASFIYGRQASLIGRTHGQSVNDLVLALKQADPEKLLFLDSQQFEFISIAELAVLANVCPSKSDNTLFMRTRNNSNKLGSAIKLAKNHGLYVGENTVLDARSAINGYIENDHVSEDGKRWVILRAGKSSNKVALIIEK